MRYRNVARGEPQRRRFISRWGSYHGGTIASAGPRRRARAARLPCAADGRFPVRQPAQLAGGRRARRKRASSPPVCVAELERTIEAAGPETIAGFVAEPISFSCGFFPPTGRKYFAGVREVLDRHGILFLDDEVICGYGRTGELFAAGALGLKPDMMSTAKGA